jgi:outer membrane protein TolC
LVAQANENFTLAQRQYAAGVGTAIEVADAQLSRSNARITDIQAQYDYATSLVKLRRAMGTTGD